MLARFLRQTAGFVVSGGSKADQQAVHKKMPPAHKKKHRIFRMLWSTLPDIFKIRGAERNSGLISLKYLLTGS